MNIASYYVLYDSKCATCSRFLRALDSYGFKDTVQVTICSTTMGFIKASGIFSDYETLERLSKRTILVSVSGKPSICLTKSRAISALLAISSSSIFRLFAMLIIVVPSSLADLAYSIFATFRRRVPLRTCSLEALNHIKIYD